VHRHTGSNDVVVLTDVSQFERLVGLMAVNDE
jgi:hypothetical protein